MPLPNNTLTAIQQKVRRLTRSPSEALLTTDDLNNYVNTFVLYDLPAHLRLFNQKTVFNFWCNPYQDVYYTNISGYGGASQASQNPLYNFQNLYLTVHPPLYIAGYYGNYTQDRTQLYAIYPQTNSIQQINQTGNGTILTFSGTIPITSTTNSVVQNGPGACLVKGNVLFDSIDVNGNGLQMVDEPCLDSVTGNPTIWGNLYVPGTQPATPPLITPPYNTAVISNNYINYVTGQFVVTFAAAPAAGQAINSQTIRQLVGLPQTVCYYDNTFILRPVPDQPYQINFEAYTRPTALLSNTSTPDLDEWWQYIAVSTAVKIFQDRMDFDSVAMIEPLRNLEERKCLRRTIVQLTNQKSATIYDQATNTGVNGTGNWGWGGGQF